MQNRISKILTGLIAGLFIAAIVLGLPFSSEAAKVTEYDNGINEYKVFYSDDNGLISAKDKEEIINVYIYQKLNLLIIFYLNNLFTQIEYKKTGFVSGNS